MVGVRTATRARVSDRAVHGAPSLMAAVDVLAGSGETGFRRVDVAIRRGADGGLRVEVAVPGQLAPAVAALLAALGARAG